MAGCDPQKVKVGRVFGVCCVSLCLGEQHGAPWLMFRRVSRDLVTITLTFTLYAQGQLVWHSVHSWLLTLLHMLVCGS